MARATIMTGEPEPLPLASRIGRFAHKYLWQSLPRALRRRALVSLTALAAPKPDQCPDPQGPVIIAGFLTASTGLGASARMSYEALRSAGVPVMGVDLAPLFRHDDRRVAFDYADGSSCVGPGSLVVYVNAPFLPLAMLRMGRAFLRRKLVVGVWAWELPEVPEEWRYGVPFVHRVVVPSTFTRDAVATIARRLRIDVLPHAVAALTANPVPPTTAGPFTALVVFNMASGFVRKNPVAAITAFRRAFGDDPGARLVVKMLNPDVTPDGAAELRQLAGQFANVELDERNLTQQEMHGLFSRADTILSLHRSEGFGLVVAEAMLAARPAIATDWSGSTDFLTTETGMPVPYRLVPALDPGGEYHNPGSVWAEPDVDVAAACLRRLRADPALCQRLGAAARADALQRFAPDRYAAQLLALSDIPPEIGDRRAQ